MRAIQNLFPALLLLISLTTLGLAEPCTKPCNQCCPSNAPCCPTPNCTKICRE